MSIGAMMKLYEIYEKTTGDLIMPVQLLELVEVGSYSFDLYEYRDVTATVSEVIATPIYEGRRKLTKLEWRKLLLPAEEEAFDEICANVETMVLPDTISRNLVRTFVNRYKEATVMDLDDPDQERGFNLLVALGKMEYNRIGVILNG